MAVLLDSTMAVQRAFQMALVVKNPSVSAGDVRDVGLIPESGRSLDEGMETHSTIHA